jgi:hypothetical protein
MIDPETIAPDLTIAPNDPGDDTARRYRFQWTWAAIVCCMMFDDTQDVVEVFCEQHEDVLLKHRDGQFTGHQVKTRESDQPVWKASDDQVKSACARFVALEGDYPGYFRAFRLVTSHPLHVANNAKGLGYILTQIAGSPGVSDLQANVGTWLRRVASEANRPETIAFQALKKATASDDLPKLRDSFARLVETVTATWPGAVDCSHQSVQRASSALIDECGKASSLDHQQALPAYVPVVNDPVQTELLARINGKRMTVERVWAILNAGLNATASLAGDPRTRTEPGHGSTELMLKKLDAGGLSSVSCNSAEDLRDKADYLGIAWTKQHGRVKGLERYDHVRSIALSDAARAFESTKTASRRFGPAMKEDLRRRFHERRARNEQLFDCSDEHLEGVAYSLTAQCKVQWSIDRPWEEE